jgi:hypothetical protein
MQPDVGVQEAARGLSNVRYGSFEFEGLIGLPVRWDELAGIILPRVDQFHSGSFSYLDRRIILNRTFCEHNSRYSFCSE